MKLKVFGIRDSKAMAFLQPYFSPSVGGAVRAFADEVNDGKGMITKHPDDFILYELGEFDDNTGLFVSLTPIVMLGCGKDFVVQKSSPRFEDLVPATAKDIMRSREEVSNGA